jgi:GDP-L-fucose synthase
LNTPTFDLTGARIWVAGHNGMVGSAVVRRMRQEPVEAILTVDRSTLDLRRQAEVERWVADNRPDIVVLAAARVGGILANDRFPADFLHDNLAIETSIIKAAADHGVRKLLFLGSSCIYPKFATQPITENSLLTGALEPTNQWYAVAKIAGLMLCDAYRRQHGLDFISAMPTNLYGPGDNYDPEGSHVIPGLIRKAIAARAGNTSSLEVWGSGTPRREFLYVDDLADALVFLLRHYSAEGPINVGSGVDVTIAELAHHVADAVGYHGPLTFDSSKPDGTPRKLLDVSKLAQLGWQSSTTLAEGLRKTLATLPPGFGSEPLPARLLSPAVDLREVEIAKEVQ